MASRNSLYMDFVTDIGEVASKIRPHILASPVALSVPKLSPFVNCRVYWLFRTFAVMLSYRQLLSKSVAIPKRFMPPASPQIKDFVLAVTIALIRE